MYKRQNKVRDVGVRHRAVTRKLKGVETTGLTGGARPALASDLLALDVDGEDA